MSIFSGMTSEGLEKTEDRLGGFQLYDTDAYDATIKMAYAGQAASGARFVFVAADIGGKEYRETIYFTNKKGENFFLNKDDKTKKVPLPGFVIVNHLSLVATGRPLDQQNTEEKMVNVYDVDQKKELPKSVPVLTDWLNKPVCLGIVRQLVNKNEKNAAGDYVPTADTREENIISKVFDSNTRGTVTEAENQTELGLFYKKWVEKNKGVVIDARKNKSGGAASGGNAGPPQAGASPAPKKSLFGND
jgi:hypothetical protein